MGFYGKATYELGNIFQDIGILKFKRWPSAGMVSTDKFIRPEPGTQEDIDSIKQRQELKVIHPDEGRDILVFRTDDPHIYIGCNITADGKETGSDVITFQHDIPYFGNTNLSNFQFKLFGDNENKNINFQQGTTLDINSFYVDAKGHVGVKNNGSIMTKQQAYQIIFPKFKGDGITIEQKNNEVTFTVNDIFSKVSVNIDACDVYGKMEKYQDAKNTVLEADNKSDTLSIKPGHYWIKAVTNDENTNDILGLYHGAALRYKPNNQLCGPEEEDIYSAKEKDSTIPMTITTDNTLSFLAFSELIFDEAGHIMLPWNDNEQNKKSFYKFTLPELPNGFGQISIGNSNIKSTIPNDILVFAKPATNDRVKIEVTDSNAIVIRHATGTEQDFNKQVVLLEGELEFGQEYSIPCFNIDSTYGHIETVSSTKFIMPVLQANEKAWIKIQSNSQIAHATCTEQKQYVNTIYNYHAFNSNNSKLLFGDIITSNHIQFDSTYGHIYSTEENTGVNYTLPSLSCDDKWLQIECKENTNEYIVSHKKPYIDIDTMELIDCITKETNKVEADYKLNFGDILSVAVLIKDETGHIMPGTSYTYQLPSLDDITINQTVKWETW